MVTLPRFKPLLMYNLNIGVSAIGMLHTGWIELHSYLLKEIFLSSEKSSATRKRAKTSNQYVPEKISLWVKRPETESDPNAVVSLLKMRGTVHLLSLNAFMFCTRAIIHPCLRLQWEKDAWNFNAVFISVCQQHTAKFTDVT
jgi:hypothetical protein